jgi:uncharacterized protein YciI
MRILLTGLVLITAVHVAAFHVPASAAPHEPVPTTFVVVYDPGPLWEADKPPNEQPGVGAHGRYLIQLYSDGIMQSAGPLSGGGGLVVFRAANEREARDIVNADPGVPSGLLQVNMLRRWDLRDWDAHVRR